MYVCMYVCMYVRVCLYVYYVTIWRFRATIVAVEKQELYIVECVCSLRYSGCNAHAPYCIVICGLSGSTIVFHIVS